MEDSTASVLAAGVAGLSGFGSSVLSTNLSYKKTKKLMDRQQNYNKENMALQQQYALDNWNLENEYNDPKNVAARYRAAGISPQAALGGGVSGSGISAGMENPSSSNPSSGSVSAPGFSIDALAALQTKASLEESRSRKEKNEAEAREADARATGQENENRIFELTRQIREADARNKSLDADLKEWDLTFAEAVKETDLALQRQKVENAREEFNEIISRYKLNDRNRELVDKTEAVLDSQINANNASAGLDIAKTKTENAIRKYEVSLKRENVHLVSAQSKEARSRAKEIDAEIERLGHLNNLTDEQIANAISARRLAWAKFGVNVLATASREARFWLQPYSSIGYRDSNASYWDNDSFEDFGAGF